jgi:hypothetical protein
MPVSFFSFFKLFILYFYISIIAIFVFFWLIQFSSYSMDCIVNLSVEYHKNCFFHRVQICGHLSYIYGVGQTILCEITIEH